MRIGTPPRQRRIRFDGDHTMARICAALPPMSHHQITAVAQVIHRIHPGDITRTAADPGIV